MLAVLASSPFPAVSAIANDENAYVLIADDGKQLQNFRIPAELDPATSPGIIWKSGTTAYKFHLALLTKHGQKDGISALAIAKMMVLDTTKIEQTADSPTVSGVIRRQAKLAENLAMNITPSFIIAGTGVMGWPGIESFKAIISSARRCDHPMCG